MIVNNILDLIGNTPVLNLKNIGFGNVFAKLEYFNPTSSVKDRASFFMIKDALDRGLINSKTTIIEPTSGNTGIALAMICAQMGFKIILTMPESMSLERRRILTAYGANLVLTPPNLGMNGAVEKAIELTKEIENSFMPSQFENISNVYAHETTTAQEIIKDFKDLDYFVCGFGTGGTISGVGKVLKQTFKNIKIIAVEPESSPLLSSGKFGPHKIQGIGANFIPKILDKSVIDDIILVKDSDAIGTANKLAKHGILCGISSGANVFASTQINDKNAKILTVIADSGDRYLSTGIFD